MKGKINFLLILVFLYLISSCSDPAETRFEGSVVPDKTVWQILTENEKYSGFVNLLKESNMDSILGRNTGFTVFVVPNEDLPDLSGVSLEEKGEYLTNHVSNFITYTNTMYTGATLKMLNGKRLFFSHEGSVFSVNDHSTLLETDIFAVNGVVHEIDNLVEVRPNLLEYIQGNSEFSYLSAFFLEGTETFFDENNSVPIGINDEGQTVYDSVWKQSNDFFTNMADLSSEEQLYTIFLAGNTFLDTAAGGSFKFGYLANPGSFIVNNLIEEDQLPGIFTAVDGFSLNVDPGNYYLLAKLSNGYAYGLNNFDGIRIPKKFSWEITEVSDFDSIRYIKATEYASKYEQLEEILVYDLNGSFTSLKYEVGTGPINKDYLKIITAAGTSVKVGIRLPAILPGKYQVKLGAQIRRVDGLKFKALMNDEEIGPTVSLNGGEYNWDLSVLGEYTITQEKGNIFTFSVLGDNSAYVRGYFDYLEFEPVN